MNGQVGLTAETLDTATRGWNSGPTTCLPVRPSARTLTLQGLAFRKSKRDKTTAFVSWCCVNTKGAGTHPASGQSPVGTLCGNPATRSEFPGPCHPYGFCFLVSSVSFREVIQVSFPGLRRNLAGDEHLTQFSESASFFFQGNKLHCSQKLQHPLPAVQIRS